MSPTPLSALSNIISSGIESIESAYAHHGVPYPSLDEPFRPDTVHDPAVMQASAAIIAAASHLIASIQMPAMYLMEQACAMHTTATMAYANELNLAEILREAGPQGLHIKEIGQRANSDPAKIGRVLRYLATRHIFKEVSPDIFTTNRISSLLDTGKLNEAILADPANKHTDSTGISALIGHFGDEVFRGSSHLPTWVKDPEMAASEEPTDAPLVKAFNSKKDCFAWFEEPGNEYRRKRFGAAMTGTNTLLPADTIVKGFDWASIPKDGVVVDVGGGVGTVTLHVAKAFPHLKYIVQDRVPVIPDAEKFWDARYPEAVKSGQVTLQGHDFFTPQPVKNASVFFLRAILHDWPTKYCKIVLKQLREAATPATQLIVVDSILPYAAESDAENAIPGNEWPKAPYPLLHNFGLANGLGYAMDIHMMVAVNAQERTIGNFVDLGNATGWKLDHVTRGIGTLSHLIFLPA